MGQTKHGGAFFVRIIADLHTHTVYSHGRGTIEDNVRAACKRGLWSVGITDHGPNHLFIGIKGPAAFRRMQQEIAKLRCRYPQIEILFGVEANIIDVDGTIDVPPGILQEMDLLLVGFHKLVRPRSLAALKAGAQNVVAGWTGRRSLSLRRLNTAAITAAVRRYPIDVITHPGLQFDIDTSELAEVCAEQGTALEISSAYCAKLEGYVREALKTSVRFVISSDAHEPERVGDFTCALALVERVPVPRERLLNLEEGDCVRQGRKTRP